MKTTGRQALERAGLPRATKMTVHRPIPCPVCGTSLGASDAITDPRSSPVPDDMTLCAECGACLIFQPDLTLRLSTQQELDECDENTRAHLLKAHRLIERAKEIR